MNPHTSFSPSLSGFAFYTSASGLARRAGVHRHVVLRLVAQAIIIPDAFVEIGDVRQPVFCENRAVEVLRAARPNANTRKA